MTIQEFSYVVYTADQKYKIFYYFSFFFIFNIEITNSNVSK